MNVDNKFELYIKEPVLAQDEETAEQEHADSIVSAAGGYKLNEYLQGLKHGRADAIHNPTQVNLTM